MKHKKMNSKETAAVRYVERKVQKFFAQSCGAPGHGIEHAARVAAHARAIAQSEGSQAWFNEIAGWLHDIGRAPEFYNNPLHKTHHELSFELLKEWFARDARFARLFSKKEHEELLYTVRFHWDDEARKFQSAVILRDADKLDLLGEEGLKRHFEGMQVLDAPERCVWFAVNVLRGSRLYSAYAQEYAHRHRLYEPFYEWIRAHLPHNKKVLCALSGGVDSAVAATILCRAGFKVIGVFMKNWSDRKGLKGECNWQEERRDALRVAAHLGIPCITIDGEKEYRAAVVKYLLDEYAKGRTPNPDVMCNHTVKFPLLSRVARQHKCAYIATGHYARIAHNEKTRHFYLQSATDSEKDQTYFLHQLKEKDLAHTLFPLNLITKNEVRMIARQTGIPVAEKPESMGICFIGEVPIQKFLQQKIKPKPGAIVTVDGKKIGTHTGLYWYTEGQRHGLGIGGGTPYFVVRKDMKRNELVVARGAEDEALYTAYAYAEAIHWINKKPRMPFVCQVRLRHRQPLFEAMIRPLTARDKKRAPHEALYRIMFKEKQRGVTPGQFAVFYQKGICLGGAPIAGI